MTIGQQEESYFGYSVPLAQSMKKQQKKESSSITEMIRDAKEKADLHREKLERAKPTPRYGDAPMEAYARLARARTVGEVSSAAGYGSPSSRPPAAPTRITPTRSPPPSGSSRRRWAGRGRRSWS